MCEDVKTWPQLSVSFVRHLSHNYYVTSLLPIQQLRVLTCRQTTVCLSVFAFPDEPADPSVVVSMFRQRLRCHRSACRFFASGIVRPGDNRKVTLAAYSLVCPCATFGTRHSVQNRLPLFCCIERAVILETRFFRTAERSGYSDPQARAGSKTN
jgi:hypothetical protein